MTIARAPMHAARSAPQAPARSDVLILGGGLMGCCTAFFLRQRHGLSVTLLERELVGRQASGTNFGNVRRQGRALAQIPLANRAREAWARTPELLGEDVEFRPYGHLRVCYTEAQAQRLVEHAEAVRPLGLDLRILSAAELRRDWGLFTGEVVAGSYSPIDGHANPRIAGPAFARAAARAGAHIVEHATVATVGPDGAGYAVHTADGRRFQADQLLISCGAWSHTLSAQFGEPVPLEPRGPQMGVTEPLPWAVGPSIGVSSPIEEEGLYFRQIRRGNIVFGGGLKGPADTATVRAASRPDNILRQLRELRRWVPAFANVQLLRTWSGIEGYTADAVPVMGPSARHRGLHYAFGFNGEGFALSPGVGEVMAELIATGRSPTPVEAFSIGRFAAAGRATAG
ncbi:NAD(P)/FAD-dependent oxidoreductase [Pseudaquabacterium rugosum]|uniref:FAD-binding oxidoreductase n=1 Tax=Pseudaquabacterium rugosum TaxID=2984194 RepID=A0ABU9B818_9BURK